MEKFKKQHWNYQLNTDNGLDKLITRLEDLFLKDEYQKTYAEFEECQKATNLPIETFINDFERLYNKAFEIGWPDQFRLYGLLKSANFEKNKIELMSETIAVRKVVMSVRVRWFK